MSNRVRAAARLTGVAVLALLLTGCIKLNMNLGINSDDTVSGSIQVGVQKELLEISGQSAEDLLGGDVPFPTGAEGVTVEPFDDGEFAGQQIVFENMPIARFNQQTASGATGPGESLSITRQGDTFVVTGVLDLSGGITGATGPFGATAGQELFESADIKIAITFPGDVVEAPGGEIDDNTVTYLPRFGERLEINATGSAIDDGDAGSVTGDDGSNLLLYLIVAGAVVVLAIILFLVMRSRRGGGGGATGFEPAQPATPVMAAPPPGAPADQPPQAPPPAMLPPVAPPPPPPSEP